MDPDLTAQLGERFSSKNIEIIVTDEDEPGLPAGTIDLVLIDEVFSPAP